MKFCFKNYAKKNGAHVRSAGTSEFDRIVTIGDSTYRVEIKASLLWGEYGQGGMRGQQIRVDQDYDLIIFIAVFPEQIEFYYATKKEVTEVVDVQDAEGNWPYNQHGGKKVRSGTFLIHGLPKDYGFMKPLESLFHA